MIINSKAGDIVYTAAVSGVNANFLRQSLESMGITEDMWALVNTCSEFLLKTSDPWPLIVVLMVFIYSLVLKKLLAFNSVKVVPSLMCNWEKHKKLEINTRIISLWCIK